MTDEPSTTWSDGEASAWLLVPIGAATLALIFGIYELLERYVLAPRLGMESLHLAHLIRGVVASVVLAGLVAWFLLRRHHPEPLPRGTRAGALVDRQARGWQHARWFVQMRWIAIGLALALIVIAVPITGILPLDTLVPLAVWWAALVVANLFFRRWIARGDPERQILVQAMVDLVVLTGFLNASGGIENPLYIAYLFHVIIAGVLLPRAKVLTICAAASVLLAALAFGELAGVIPHHTNVLFPHVRSGAEEHDHTGHEQGPPAEVRDRRAVAPAEREGLVADATGVGRLEGASQRNGHASHAPVFVAGRVLPFVCVLFLSAYLTTLVADRLHRSEADLERVAKAALLEQQRLEGVVDAAGVGITVIGPDGEPRWSTRLAIPWSDEEPHARSGDCPRGGASGGCRACLVSRTFELGEPQESERAMTSERGASRSFRFATSPVKDEDGAVVQVVELSQDITARKALEARALHTGKLSVLGHMAAGVAHEIGNPLSSLTARIQLMERRRDPGFLDASLGVLREQIGRIGRIVHGISQFARPRRQEWASWEVNGVVREALDLLRVDRRAKRIDFDARLADPSPRVRGVRDQIVQVCLNLLLNAIEASPEGGAVELRTTQRGDEVVLTVSDAGVGIDPELQARLFDPFFTTKTDGSGLGLSISYALVHAHGGRIEVESEGGRGSVFRVFLPTAGDAAPGAPGAGAA